MRDLQPHIHSNPGIYSRRESSLVPLPALPSSLSKHACISAESRGRGWGVLPEGLSGHTMYSTTPTASLIGKAGFPQGNLTGSAHWRIPPPHYSQWACLGYPGRSRLPNAHLLLGTALSSYATHATRSLSWKWLRVSVGLSLIAWLTCNSSLDQLRTQKVGFKFSILWGCWLAWSLKDWLDWWCFWILSLGRNSSSECLRSTIWVYLHGG